MSAPLLARWHGLTLHWPVWLGGLALALSVAFHLGLTQPWQTQADAQLRGLQAAAVQSAATWAAQSQQAAMQAQHSAADDELPPPALGPQRAAALMAMARHQGVAVVLVQEQTDTSGQLQVAMQGKARYPALRALVGRALNADPALALERLSLRRAEPSAAELDFELLWTFVHRLPLKGTGPASTARGAR